MNSIKRMRPSYAAVTSTLALVLALGMGGAYAASKITSKQITTSAVKSKHIKDGQVRTADFASDARVASAKAADTANAADSAKRAETASAVAPNAVSGAGVEDGSLRGADIANDSVSGEKIVDGTVGRAQIGIDAVGSLELLDGSVTKAELSNATVGGRELQDQAAFVGPGVTVPAGQARTTEVRCPEGSHLMSGGFAWSGDSLTAIVSSAPVELDPNDAWAVRGFVPAGQPANNLFAWATCLTE
jgi:hypothetical protein